MSTVTNEDRINPLRDLADVMRSIDGTLKELVAFLQVQKRPAKSVSQALALLIELGPDIQSIADRLGVNRSTLYRWKAFMDQYEKVQRFGTPGKRGAA